MSLLCESYRWVRRLRDKAVSCFFARGFHAFGARSVICLPVRLAGERAIEIGHGVYVGANCWIEVMHNGAAPVTPVISIGDHTSIAGSCTITGVKRVTIGRGVLIARFVHISDHSHACDSATVPIKDQGLCRIGEVVIGDGAWIGHGAVICPGVSIGRNAVVGANAVVRDDVPEHTVAVGVPARMSHRVKSEKPAS